MQLPRDGLEYARITFDDVPFGATVEASIDRASWTVVPVTNSVGLYLLRGPDSVSTDGTLVATNSKLWIRVSDSPEVVVRAVATISLY